MTEEFVSERESVDWAGDGKLRSVKSPQPTCEEFDSLMEALEDSVARRDLGGVLNGLHRLVPEYRPSEAVLKSRKARESRSL